MGTPMTVIAMARAAAITYRRGTRNGEQPSCPTWKSTSVLDSRPGGLAVVGDALCSFNPIYGQGMTVAVMEAELLETLLEEGRDDLPERRASRIPGPSAELSPTMTRVPSVRRRT
jgi:2-polyprenyl-6-methoxyphenol hydroxylase-like FAD-dependent oxidoreductase